MVHPRFVLLLVVVSFPGGSLVPREENAPKKGALLWHLGRVREFEGNRTRYLKAYRERYLAPGLRSPAFS
jgi:hypothetical protein